MKLTSFQMCQFFVTICFYIKLDQSTQLRTIIFDRGSMNVRLSMLRIPHNAMALFEALKGTDEFSVRAQKKREIESYHWLTQWSERVNFSPAC